MAHIELGNDAPGIRGLMQYRPETGKVLNELAEVLLRDENSLTRGERELIATYVSTLNQCRFCSASHKAFAAAQLPGGHELVAHACSDLDTAPISDKLKALLHIAGHVQQIGTAVTEKDVALARDAGATDIEIHDTVLIAAAFCMYNRYVDGLGTFAPDDPASYDQMAQLITTQGYAPRP
ncbi:carboxymuconolactone decarboxylase family protein [Sphaerisporangium corydalis]|uniref:Carboxymuconolactone decarboxylase family protein n=1 Tax=Sphaerisporangium corydalis TaxID=1441875 RepID=A0ABV9E9L9_9ACTN|nr:peroxidase-related enzyme [Sphaerisporangium corydalis]